MKSKTVIGLVLVILLCAAVRAQEKKEQTDPEEQAWNKVKQMEVVQLDDFLKASPNGKYAAEAKFALSLHKKIADIKSGKAKSAIVIPFAQLGERWKYWCKANPEKGAVGVYRNESTAGIFRALGCATISTDYSGMIMAPTGHGSIIAIKTSGLGYAYISNDIVFTSDKDETLYFGVIEGKGLAHLAGKGKVKVGEKETDLK